MKLTTVINLLTKQQGEEKEEEEEREEEEGGGGTREGEGLVQVTHLLLTFARKTTMFAP